MPQTFDALTDRELAAMIGRSFREAARCWNEARAGNVAIRPMLVAAAESADAYWRDLADESDRRLAGYAAVDGRPIADVRSADQYAVASRKGTR